jgi:ABC-type lipoprotein release transport system permease subunit
MAIPFSYSFRNLWTRKWTSILTAGGMALVTFVFAAVLMLAQGLQQTLIDTGSPDNAIVLRGGAETEVSSAIDRSAASIIEVQPEVALNGRGEPVASKEALVLVMVPKKRTNVPTNVVVRGVGSHAMNLRPQVKLIAGRNFRPGSREVIAGKSIAETVKGGSLGQTLSFALSQWNVVGVFDAGKTAFNSEVWGDADQLLSAFRRTTYSDVILKVPGKEAFEELQNRLRRTHDCQFK